MRSIIERRITGLDGLRAVAITFVIAAHSFPAALDMFDVGSTGVSVFFVISGYLITTLLSREEGNYGRIDLMAFYLRRCRRIFPALFIFIAVMALLSASSIVEISRRDILASLFFLKNYTLTDGAWYVHHMWSLSVEEQFYLLWPVTLAFLGSKRGLAISLFIVALSPFVRVASYFLWPASRDFMGFMFHTRADFLAAGCALALFAQRDGFLLWIEATYRPWRLVALILLGGVVSPLLAGRFGGYYLETVGYSVQVISISLILAWAVHCPDAGWALALEWRPLTYIGALSYSLYLWQEPLTGPFSLVSYPWNFIVIAFLGAASYYLIERPFLAIKIRKPSSTLAGGEKIG